MQRLIIPDLWILLSGLFWSWYRIHCRRSLYFCAWMIRWYLNLAQNLKMFQNCLTMPHTTVPTIWMDTALWESCSAYLSGMGIKYLIFHCTYTEKLGEKTVKAYRIDLSSVWFWSPVKSKTKRSLRNILRNYIKNTNINRTAIKKSRYFVGNGRGNGKKYFYENRFPFRCI